MVHRKANRDANGISFLTDNSSDLFSQKLVKENSHNLTGYQLFTKPKAIKKTKIRSRHF